MEKFTQMGVFGGCSVRHTLFTIPDGGLAEAQIWHFSPSKKVDITDSMWYNQSNQTGFQDEK